MRSAAELRREFALRRVIASQADAVAFSIERSDPQNAATLRNFATDIAAGADAELLSRYVSLVSTERHRRNVLDLISSLNFDSKGN